MYRLELHAHSSEVSTCAHADAETVIRRYRATGYHGLVSTNHINGGTYQRMEEWPWEKRAEYFIAGYNALKKAAGEDFDVLLGCEINLRGSANDYLVFGVTEDWLLSLGDPRGWKLDELSGRVRSAGLMIVQAHPFRYGCVIMRDELLDGVEVFNGNAWHDSHNYMAALWARKKHLIATSGSDTHNDDSPINGGIETEERIRDNQALLHVLRTGSFRLLGVD